MNGQPVLRIEGLSKRFRVHAQGKSIPSAQAVDLEVYPGRLTALVGPTGCGKSSILKCVYRTYLPSSGRILFCATDGRLVDLAAAGERAILALRRREISFVTQFLHCIPRQPCEELIAAPLRHRGWNADHARARARSLLAKLDIPERLWSLSPATFSGGERQRINLARGFAGEPRLLLLDEPTASLDAAAAEKVLSIIEGLKAKGVAILAVFHQAALVASLADLVVGIPAPAKKNAA